MAEAVPLCATLGVEGPDVVVDDAWRLLVDLFVEGLAAEEGEVALCVERPVEANADAGLDLACGCFDNVGREAVERA